MRFTYILTLMSLMTLLNSCYRMPTDDDYSVIPMTNSPDVAKHHNNFMPDMNN